MLLAIDSSAGTSAALLGDDGTLLAERASADTRAHAETIGVLIAGALADAGARPADVTAVAVGMGPGPFTGLRVGIAAGHAFAAARGVPVLPVVSHDAIALGADGPVVVVADARRREHYWSVYSGSDAAGLPVRTAGPAVGGEDAVPGGPRRDEPARASDVGRIAHLRRVAGRPADADVPLYLREPDVTVKRVAS